MFQDKTIFTSYLEIFNSFSGTHFKSNLQETFHLIKNLNTCKVNFFQIISILKCPSEKLSLVGFNDAFKV